MLNSQTLRSIWKRITPGVEAVTFKSRGTNEATASYTSYSLSHAKKRPRSYREMAQDGMISSTLATCRWDLWQDDLDAVSAPNPKVGDVITDSSNIDWLVQSVEHKLFTNAWFLETTIKP